LEWTTQGGGRQDLIREEIFGSTVIASCILISLPTIIRSSSLQSFLLKSSTTFSWPVQSLEEPRSTAFLRLRMPLAYKSMLPDRGTSGFGRSSMSRGTRNY
jgi:hypothetical protein